jgi:hypothetical protein
VSQGCVLIFHFQRTEREAPYSALPHDEPCLADRLPFNLCGGSRLNEGVVLTDPGRRTEAGHGLKRRFREWFSSSYAP